MIASSKSANSSPGRHCSSRSSIWLCRSWHRCFKASEGSWSSSSLGLPELRFAIVWPSRKFRLNNALKVAGDFYGDATDKILPTPTPEPLVDWAAVQSVAAERLSQGQAWASEQYESAKIAVGLATATPTSPVDRLLENAKYNYYAGVGVAHARYTEFMAAASSAFSSMTATPTPTDFAGTMSSMASVVSASAGSAASVASETSPDGKRCIPLLRSKASSCSRWKGNNAHVHSVKHFVANFAVVLGHCLYWLVAMCICNCKHSTCPSKPLLSNVLKL